jgi:magnesium transporter
VADEQHGGHDGELYETGSVGAASSKAHNGCVIVDCALYHHGRREHVEGDLHEALQVARTRGDSFIWIGLHDPEAAELEKVAKEFALHPLSVEDAVKAHQRPKVEDFDDSLFVVLKTVRYDEPTQQLDLGDVMLFLGDSFIVSVRHGQARALSGVRARLEEETKLLDCGPSAVLYAVCDAIVDDYSEIAYAVEQDIDEVEERVFSSERSNEASRIYNLKREVIEFRRGVRPLVEPMNKLATGMSPRVHEHLQPFFRDVADHALRVAEQVEGFDDLLTSVLNANLAQVSVQQNSDMRKISAWVAIAAVPTAIAGIYGMNFEYMPELHWHAGYPLALVLMAGICAGLYRAFKRSGWL